MPKNLNPTLSGQLCECGCGQETLLVDYNRSDRGLRKGTPRRFVAGHAARNTGHRFLTGEGHQGWRGDEVGYRALHDWMNDHHPRTGQCEHCGSTNRKTEYAQRQHGRLSRNREDWLELCRSCHRKYDRWDPVRFSRKGVEARRKRWGKND